MLNHRQKEIFETWQIEPFDPLDMMDTIQQAKQIIKVAPTKKYNMHTVTQAWDVLRYHMPKVLLLQGILCLFALLYICTQAPQRYQLDKSILYYGISFTGIINMVAMSGEMLRVRIMNTWELERTCAMRLEKLLVIKMFMLGSFSTFLIFLISITSWLIYDVSFWEIACYGYAPFLLLTALILQISMHMDSKEGILVSYAGGIALYLSLVPILTKQLSLLLVFGLCVLALFFCLLTLKQFYERSLHNWGGSLC